MKINVLTQLREMIEDLLSGQTKLRKSFRNFFIETMILYIVMRGRINYSSMAMAGDSCEMAEGDNGKPIVMYVGEVWVNCLDRVCKVVIVDYLDPDKKKQTRTKFGA